MLPKMLVETKKDYTRLKPRTGVKHNMSFPLATGFICLSPLALSAIMWSIHVTLLVCLISFNKKKEGNS